MFLPRRRDFVLFFRPVKAGAMFFSWSPFRWFEMCALQVAGCVRIVMSVVLCIIVLEGGIPFYVGQLVPFGWFSGESSP